MSLTNESYINTMTIKQKIIAFYKENTTLHEDNFNSFIEYINIKSLILSNEDNESLYNYLIDFQETHNIENEPTNGILLNYCIDAFGELLEYNDDDKKKRQSNLYNNDDVILETEQDRLETEYDNLTTNISELSLINAKRLLELLYDTNFLYNGEVKVESRVYAISDIAIILNKHSYINITSLSFISLIAFFLEISKDDVRDITYNVKNFIIESIDSTLSIQNEDEKEDEEKLIQKLSHKGNSILNSLTKNEKSNFNEGNLIYIKFEELDERLVEIINEDTKFLNEMIFLLEVSQFMYFTIQSQIIIDLIKLKANKYDEYEIKKA